MSRAVDRIARTTRGSRAERRLLEDAEAFAGRTRTFAGRVDLRDASPSSRRREVARLELLDRMEGALAGRRPGGGRQEPASSAAPVRGLARELDEAASRARDRAERIAGGDPGLARDSVNGP